MSTEVTISSITIKNCCKNWLVCVMNSIFSGSGNRELAESICQHLGVPLQSATVSILLLYLLNRLDVSTITRSTFRSIAMLEERRSSLSNLLALQFVIQFLHNI